MTKPTPKYLVFSVLTAVLLAQGCAHSAKPNTTFQERVAACEWHCAELALGLVEQGLYAEAVPPLAKALRHAAEVRPDVPYYAPDLRNHAFRLTVAQVVVARHLDSVDAEVPLNNLWQGSTTLLHDATFDTLAGTEIEFLRKTDRLWLLKRLAEARTLGQETRELLTLVLRANSKMSVDRLALGRLSKEASTIPQHQMAAHIYCAIDACGSQQAVNHLAVLIDEQLQVPPEEFDALLLQSDAIDSFLQHADASHKKQVLGLRDAFAAQRKATAVTFPVRALGRTEACKEFRPLLQTVVRDTQASYQALVDAGRCATSLGYENWGLTMLDRAMLLREDPTEAIDGMVEYGAFNVMSYPGLKRLEKLHERWGRDEAQLYAEFGRALREGRAEDAAVLVAGLPSSPVRSFFQGRLAYARWDLDEAATSLEEVRRHWPAVGILNRWTLFRLGRVEEALQRAQEDRRLDVRGWRARLGLAAAFAGEHEVLEPVLKEFESQTSCGSYVDIARFLWAAGRADEALERLDTKVLAATEEAQKKCGGAILLALETILTPEQAEKHVLDWSLSEDVNISIVQRGNACTDTKLAARRKQLAATPNDLGRQNGLAWCLVSRKDFRSAAEVLPDPQENLDAIDTRARIDLGLGDVEKALKQFEALARRNPASFTFATHHLAARLLSSTPPAAPELQAEIERIGHLSAFFLWDPFVLETLLDALESKGHEQLARKLMRNVAVRTTFPRQEIRDRITRRCSECRNLFFPPQAPSVTPAVSGAPPNQ